jgi:hypothetical protein
MNRTRDCIRRLLSSDTDRIKELAECLILNWILLPSETQFKYGNPRIIELDSLRDWI